VPIPYDNVCLFFASLKSFDSTITTSSGFSDGPLVDMPGHRLDRTPVWDGLRGGSVNIQRTTYWFTTQRHTI